jgi:hypothetical protein
MSMLFPIRLSKPRDSIHLSGEGWTFVVMRSWDLIMCFIEHVSSSSGMMVNSEGRVETENEP